MTGEDLSGQRFGSLLVVGRSTAPDRHNRVMWICRCDCGRARTVSTRELKRGRTLYSKNLYTADDLEYMIQDWFDDHQGMFETDGLVLDGAPYYAEDDGVWRQDVHDDSTSYLLVADDEGSIDIRYAGTR